MAQSNWKALHVNNLAWADLNFSPFEMGGNVKQFVEQKMIVVKDPQLA